MIKHFIEKYVFLLLILIGIAVFAYWQIYDPVKGFTVNIPGLDNRPEVDLNAIENVAIGEKFTAYNESSSELSGKWTGFRGADRDNINKENIRLIDSWGPGGPKIEWVVDLGEGHAAPVIYNGKVYILDYHEIKKADALRCFSLETGEEIWRRWYNIRIKRNHGMSRTVPAITDKYIVTIGPKGHVMCVNPENGDFLWGIDLVKNYSTEIPFWYTGQCPLIDNDVAVIAPGGSSLLMGVDCASGEVIWQTPNPDNWKMSHSSIMPMTLSGKKMYVYAAIGGIVGVSAGGSDPGKVLWKTNTFAPSVVAPSPVILDDGKIFITAGYGAGSILFQVVKSGNSFEVNVLQKYKPKDGLAAEQQTPLFYDGFLFSILPKDAGNRRNQFVCCDPNDCQSILWTSGKTKRFGLGPYIVADNKFFILNDDGTLTIAKANTSRFEFLDKAKIMEGQDAWGPIAIADGRLLMRDSKKLVCVNIKAK
ncbi:MAG: PQQ-binding-like beta-propeller repeat protein [Bacteroidetes bacterium]|nr:PQQ-binding-like beta-propeller repeat protein [Bacteroidota bacterium]MBL7105048.1 PQQ-binding-like beta-propeller repeat protein [Bacteroidales bacterium]